MIFVRGRRFLIWLFGIAGLTGFFTFVLVTRSPAPWMHPTPAGASALADVAQQSGSSDVDPSGSQPSETEAPRKPRSSPYVRIGEQFGKVEPNEKDAAFLKSIREGSAKVAQDDPRLIEVIVNYFLIGPSNEEYDMTTDEEDTSMGQAAVVNDIFNGKMGGFYVECGALDGETRSNTYFFERSLHWEGILIEADPSNFELLLKKHRKSFSLNACLSTSPHPVQVVFQQHFNIGQITKYKKVDPKQKGLIGVLCFPFYSVMLALNRTTVDYFSLDVEGADLDVVKTIPFKKLNVRTLSVEFSHVKEGEKALKKYMEKNGFEVHSKVTHKHGLANDFIFKKGRF